MSKGTILIVDDDQSLTNLLKLYFEADSYIVQVLSNGADALVEAQSDIPPDVIALNSHLPDISGHKVVIELRNNSKTKRIPIIVFTQEKMVDRLTSLDSGADDYITKPFARGELSARIRHLIQRSRQTFSENKKDD